MDLLKLVAYEPLIDLEGLPSSVRLVAIGMTRIHWLWRLNRKRKLYQDPDNWAALAIGHLAEKTIGKKIIHLAAKILLIATRLHQLSTEIQTFKKELNLLAEAVDGYYLPTKPLKEKQTFFAARVSSWKERQAVRVYRIKVCVMRLTVHIFNIVMVSLDIYEGLYRTDDAMQEVVINGRHWIHLLDQKKESLVQGLRETEPLIDRIFSRFKINYSGKKLIAKLEPAVKVAFKGMEQVHCVDRAFGKEIRNTIEFYKVLFGLNRL